MLISELKKKGLISPPKFLISNLSYLTSMGSDAYGASSGSSDLDIYGFCVPSKADVFPFSTDGKIFGFGSQPSPFNVWTEHHIRDGDKEYDLTVYSIVRFFNLALDASPNIVDSIFTPLRCVVHTTNVGNHVRENRKLFLSGKLKPRLLGYSYAQLNKLKNGDTPFVQFIRENNLGPEIFEDSGVLDLTVLSGFSKIDELIELANKYPIKQNAKRRADIIRNGYSTKEGYHVVRLALQCEQVLSEGDLDLERNSGILKAIRRGEWSFEHLVDWFSQKEKSLEEIHAKTKLPYSPDETAIKTLLLECLEMHYGSISDAIQVEVPVEKMLAEMQAVIDRYK